LEHTETTEKENEFFDIKELKTLVISAFDKEIQNKTHQKEKNRSQMASVMAGAGGCDRLARERKLADRAKRGYPRFWSGSVL